jgi:hypothetical protein
MCFPSRLFRRFERLYTHAVEEFVGDTALDIVRAMMITPFAASLPPVSSWIKP